MKNAVVIEGVQNFNISQILECGQVFRFEKICDSNYTLVAKDKTIKITQQPQSTSIIIKNTTAGELEEIWKPYLDLDTDYSHITDILSNKDEHMKKAVEFGAGIRILRQDPWEMLISFIISQNKAIPHIKQCIHNITSKYGHLIEENSYGQNLYTFPSPEQLIKVSDEQLRDCKVGFRAPYILDATNKVINGTINLNEIFNMNIEDARQTLMQIKGVGPKIADCVLLFAYNKLEVFPTDVWIKRVIEGYYFEGKEVPLPEIQKFAKNYFGDLAGYAQQYLFFHGREEGLFKKEKKT